MPIPKNLKSLRLFRKSYETPIVKSIVEAPKVKYYGPTMGKTTAVASNPRLVDFDDIIRQPSRTILDRYGFKTKSDMYNSGNQEAIGSYENMLIKMLQDWRSNPKNSGLTLVASPTAIANPEITGFYFDNVPSIPSRDVFITRNVGRGGTPEASALWYDSLIKKNPNLKIDDRFVSQIEYLPSQTKHISLEPESNFMSLGPEWEGLESPYLTVYHRGLDGQQPYEHPKFKGILGGAGYDSSLDSWFNIKPEFKMAPNEARHFNLKKLADKYFGGDTHKALDHLNKNR